MIYKIKNFEINSELREIYLSGDKLNIEPKVYDLILFLIENPNRAISKDQLQDAVWSNLEVSETAITRAIMKARKVLNDGENNQSYIQTVHGHGYKFLADIKISSTETNIQDSIVDKKPLPLWKKNKVGLGAIVLAILFSFIGVGILFKTNEVFAIDSKLAILPFINEIEDKKYQWTSIGLMSIAEQMIKAENSIKTVSNKKASRIKDFNVDEKFNIDDDRIESIKAKLQASHLVIVKLENTLNDQFKLRYVIYHTNGKQDVVTLIGDNPTELTQQMVGRIIKNLPGASISNSYRAVSDDFFTNELYARGVALRLEGRAKEARDYFKLVMKEEPDLFWPRYQFALTTTKLGLYDEAISELEQLIEDIPNILHDKDLEAGVNNALGNAYMKKSDHEIGIKYYTKAYNIAIENKNKGYEEKIASNIAWIYKDKKEFDKSRAWLAKSMNSRKEQKLPRLSNNVYLMGQLEYLMRHFDKAETIFYQAYKIYMDGGFKLQAAKVLNLITRIQRIKGLWKSAHETMNQASELSNEIDDDLGRLENQLSISTILYDEGRYSEALDIISKSINKAKDLKQEKKHRNALVHEIRILFKQKQYDLVLSKIKLLPANKFPKKSIISNLETIKLKISYLNGDKSSLEQWLDEFSNQPFDNDLNDQVSIKNLELFVLEEQNKSVDLLSNHQIKEGLIDSYRKYIDLSYSIGNQALSVKYYIKMAHLYLSIGDFESANNVFSEISLHNLDWWQIDLLHGLILFESGELDKAIELAGDAKQNATESWSEKDENRFQKIVSNN